MSHDLVSGRIHEMNAIIFSIKFSYFQKIYNTFSLVMIARISKSTRLDLMPDCAAGSDVPGLHDIYYQNESQNSELRIHHHSFLQAAQGGIKTKVSRYYLSAQRIEGVLTIWKTYQPKFPQTSQDNFKELRLSHESQSVNSHSKRLFQNLWS